MYKFLGLFLLLTINLFAQEEVGPIMQRQELAKSESNLMNKSNAGTFDSTFIYIPDTLSIRLFDDFSTNKFQTYNADYSDLGVTFDKKYRLLDVGSSPLAADVLYTEQVTFKRVFDVANSSFTDIPFSSVSIQKGDLSSYPVVYNPIAAYPPYYIYDTLDYPNPVDTIWILDAEIYQDSATQFFAPINDKEKYWLESEAYHNYSMAKDPWSIGVATFDGLDENGYPYAIGTNNSGFADHLTSKPIDMTPYDASDSIRLSFLYQPQGLCDAPEAGDSLFLEFYEKGTDQWNTVWSGGGTSVQDFDFGHILIDSVIYFTDYFQFRFKNYGGLSGSLDHFHLDYVELDLSFHNDTLFEDFAFVYPIYTLLNDYTSVPWDHYKNNFAGKMTDAAKMVIRNGSITPENNNLNGSVEVSYGGGIEGTFVLNGANLSNGALNYGPRTTYVSYHDFSSGYHFDETKPGIEEEFDILGIVPAQFTNETVNDSVHSKQVFKNYYSYDDGTAELAYGPTGLQSQLAIKYIPYEADSLVGAMINFVPSVYDVSNKLFILTVWDDNNGVPGSVLYEDESFFPRTPSYGNGSNDFAYYFFKDTMKLNVSGTFYIGWRQFDSQRLNVGLDMNIVNNDKTFYSVNNGNTWNQSGFLGSVMIRPIFSTAMDVTLGIPEVKNEDKAATIFPNPSNGVFEIKTKNFESAEVFDIQGKMVCSTNTSSFDISALQNGIFFVRIKGDSRIYKVIKN